MTLKECSALLAAIASASSNRSAHAARQLALVVSLGSLSELDLLKADVVPILCGLLRKTQDQVAEAASALAVVCRDRPSLQGKAVRHGCVALLCGLLKAAPKVSIPSAAALCSICSECTPAQDEARVAGALLVLPPLLLSPSFELVAAAAQAIAAIVTVNVRGQESCFSSSGFAHCAVVACIRPPLNNVSTSSAACAAAATTAVASLPFSPPAPPALFTPKSMDSVWNARCAWALFASGCIAFDLRSAQTLSSSFGCMHVAVSLLDSEDGDVRSLAARALGCFCVNNKSLQLLALELGALPRLHRMLASPMLHMKQHAALSISFLCSTNSMAQLAATEAGTLSVVQDLFRSSRTEVLVTGLRFIFNLAYDNTKAQEQFLKLGVMTDIIAILKSARVSKDDVAPLQPANASGSESEGDSDDAEFWFTFTTKAVSPIAGTSDRQTRRNILPARTIHSTAEVEWAVKALTNLIQLAGGACNPSAQAQAAAFGAFDFVAALLLSRREEIVQWACRCLASLVKGSVNAHAAAVSLVVPRLLALSEHHEEAAAALRVIFAASPAAVASRDVFRSMDALLRQLPSSMFTSAANVEAELSVISQLRSIICTRRSSFEELGNVGGAVACNSFIVLGGVRALIACFNSNLCANKSDAFRISECIGNCISSATACSAATSPPLSLCAATLSRFVDSRLEESERVVCVLALVALFRNRRGAVLKLLLRSRALVPILRACFEHPSLLHLVSAAAGFSGHHASILINSGAIPVLSSILSLHLNGKQQDIVHLACKCLLKLASARLSDECAASAAESILKCPLMHALAALVAPPLPPPSPKLVKSKSSRFINAEANEPSASAAAAIVSKAAADSLQAESIKSVATAAVCSIVQSWFIWQPMLLNSIAVQAGVVESLCRAAASAAASRKVALPSSDVQAAMATAMPQAAADVLLHATIAMAHLAYEDRSTAAVVASNIFSQQSAVDVAISITSGFAPASPLSPTRSTSDKTGQAPAAVSFAAHSTHLIGLLALLICHDPVFVSSGIAHRSILIGDSALSALHLLAGAWPYVQGETRRWVSIAVCMLLPLVVHQGQTPSSTLPASVTEVHSKADVRTNTEVNFVSHPLSSAPPLSKSSVSSQSPHLARLLCGVAAGSSSPNAGSPAVKAVASSPTSPRPQPPVTDRSTVLPDEQGIMSAVYSNQYARFHPLLTFSLKLQASEDTDQSRLARRALLRLPPPLQMLAATLPLHHLDSASNVASPRSSAIKKSLCLLCRAAQAPPRLLLLCGHTFHIACARSHIEKYPMCPLCKWPLVALSADASTV